MSAMPESYEVLAVRYGTRQASAAQVFFGYEAYGEPDRPVGMDYFFWVIRGSGRTIVVDTGFSPRGGAARRRTTLLEQPAALRAAGVDPGSAAQVIVTHGHYDHIGGLAAFRAAEVIMTRTEYDFWTGPIGSRPLFASHVEPAEISHLRDVHASGRMTLVSGGYQVAPGVTLTEVGGHTPGQAIVTVETGPGRRLILASDAVHYYEELERDWPFITLDSLAGMYATFDLIREMAREPGVTVIAGHDPVVRERFPALPDREGVTVLSGPDQPHKRP